MLFSLAISLSLYIYTDSLLTLSLSLSLSCAGRLRTAPVGKSEKAAQQVEICG